MGNGMHAEKERIVIVEDDAKLAALIGEFLRSQDLDVELIEDGSRAVGTILANPPALVVLDLMLPGVDGLSVCRKLREAGFSRPILMLTARSDDQDHIRGLELGADDFVNKPVRPQVLLARIRALLRRVESDSSERDRKSTRLNSSHV